MEREQQVLGKAQRAGVRLEDEGEAKGGVEVEAEGGGGEGRKWGRRTWRGVADGRTIGGKGGAEKHSKMLV